MLRVNYTTIGNVADEREFKDDDEFIEWLHRQLDIERVTINFMEENRI